MEEDNKYRPPTHPIQWKVTRIHKPPSQELPAKTIQMMGRIHYDVVKKATVVLKCAKEYIEAVPDSNWTPPVQKTKKHH